MMTLGEARATGPVGETHVIGGFSGTFQKV
jgi:hypothetical protein